MLRNARLVSIGAVGGLLLALFAAHTGPARSFVLRRITDSVRASHGIHLRVESFSYNLLTLSAELGGARLSAVDTPDEPFLTVDTVALSFGPRTLIGDISVERLSMASPRIDIRRRDDATDNLPDMSGAQSNNAAFVLPRMQVDDLDISFQQPSTSMVMRGVAFRLGSTESGGISMTADAQHGVQVIVGDRTIDFDRFAVSADLEGERVDLRELTASRPGSALHARGSIALGGDASTVDITVTGWSELQSWRAEIENAAAPAGRVNASGRVSGRVSEPTITFEATSGTLAWPDLQVRDVSARGVYQNGELSLSDVTAGIAGGTLEVHGGIVLDGAHRTSRIEARWADIDARRVPAVASLDGTISKDGTAIVEWRADGTSLSPRIEVTATTGFVSSGRTTPLIVRASGRGDRWHVELKPRDTNAVDVAATAVIRVDSRRWQASSIDGRVVLRTSDLPAAIHRAQHLGIAASFDPDAAAGTIDLDAAIDGTVDALRSTGRIVGRAVTVSGLPRMDFDATFGVDVARKISTGTFRLLAPGLDSATFAAKGDVAVAGSLIAEGSWSGPLSDPAVEATVAGRDLTVSRGGSVSIAATRGTLDGVLKGPVSNLDGGGRLTIESTHIAGREAGAITADLTLSAGAVRVKARAPSVKTTLDVSIAVENPYTFDGRAAMVDCDIDTLLAMAGLVEANRAAVRGRISSSIAFKGDVRTESVTTLTLDVAPIDATVFDVPIAISRGLRASVTGGLVQLEDATITLGGLEMNVGGSIATDRSTGGLTLDVDGELGPLSPWLTRLDASGAIAVAGRVTGHLEAEASSLGVAATGTVDAVLATVSKADRILAKDVRATIVLAGQRATVRNATGSILGGPFTASADAPLTWLNQWLPSPVRLTPPPGEAPGTFDGRVSFDVPALFALLERPPLEALGGGFELSANLSASRPHPAALVGDVRIERLEVIAQDLKYAQSGVTVLRLAEGALSVDGLDVRGPGSQVVGRGSIGLVDGIETNLRLDIDTGLAIVGALLSGRASGRFAGSVELHGRSDALRVTSDATLNDASWLIPGERLLFANWSGRIRLADRALSITQLGGTVNGGSVRIDGRLPLDAAAGGGELTIAARDILLDVPRGLRSQLGADLVWQRTARAAQLHGKVEITANRYTEPVTRILQLVNAMSSATRGTDQSRLPSWLADTALDISVAVSDPILIDNSAGTLELMPHMRLAGTIDSPALAGRVEVVDDGRITIGGRAYRLRDSEVRFAPADGLVPTVDAVGETRIGDYDVTIRVSGTPDRIETSFSSVPPLGERELQSLIVTGQTGEQTMQNRQSDDNFAAAAAATDILGFAGRFVGLDTVRIGTADLDLVSKDISPAQHLTVSKSLGSSFELIFSDNLEDGSVTWVLVWKPTSVNEVRASSVEDGTRTLEFRRTLVFGPGSPTGTGRDARATAQQSRAVVQSVQITGAPGFSEQQVAGELELDVGNRFEVRRWIEDRYRLEKFYLDRGYHRVRIVPARNETVDRTHVSLTYKIERGPRTVIEMTGDSLPGEVTDAMYGAWRGLPIADVVRTEFERIAREGLARRGYYSPSLQIDFSAETPDLARVTMRVLRGPQTSQLNVAWSGNRDISNGELDALVAPHRAQSAVWLDTQALAWQLQQLYASRGHLQARVAVGEPSFEGTAATLPIVIDEGILSRLADVQLHGVDPSRQTGATEALGLAIGEPFAASAPVDAERRLEAFYMGLGYRSAAVTHTVATAKDGAVSIAWTVKEGPLHRVKEVDVVGVETTSGGLVRNAITLAPGDAMSQTAIETTRRNLYEIGSFRRVDFDFGDGIQPADAGELPLTLTIRAEEPQRFQLRYGVQFSVDRSTGASGGTAVGVSVELRDRNFIGRAVQASVSAHWDPDLQTVGTLFSSPRLFGRRVRTNLYARIRYEQETVDTVSALAGAPLEDRRREVMVEQRWRPAAMWELVWGYNFSSRRFLLDRDDQHFDGGGLLAGPTVSVILDRRDSPFDATRGFFHSSSVQFGVEPLGSDLGYFRYLFRQSYYQPLARFTAAGNVRYGTLQDYSGVVPLSIIDLLFNAGGTNSVRGYSEDALSAINIAGFALGGAKLLVLNGELRFPMTKRLGGAVFVDAGNTFRRIEDVSFGDLAVGAGLGLRIRTPLAPFRLDVAYPFSDAYGTRNVRVHFSIGQMF